MPTGLTSPVHLLVIMVVAMVVLGPEKLPQAMRQAGKFVAEVRRWSSVVSVDLKDVLSLDAESNTGPAVTATAINGNGHLSATSSVTAAPAPPSPSVPSALSPAGEWGEFGLGSEETGGHNPIPPALREGGEWSDPR